MTAEAGWQDLHGPPDHNKCVSQSCVDGAAILAEHCWIDCIAPHNSDACALCAAKVPRLMECVALAPVETAVKSSRLFSGKRLSFFGCMHGAVQP